VTSLPVYLLLKFNSKREFLSEYKNQNEFEKESVRSMVQAQAFGKPKSIGLSLVSVNEKQKYCTH